jgi:hypothetical protein
MWSTPMRHAVLLVATLVALWLTSNERVAMASGPARAALAFDPIDDARFRAGMALSGWGRPAGPTTFSLFPPRLVSESGLDAGDPLQMQAEPGLAGGEPHDPRASGRDWAGLGRDTAFFMGYQAVIIGILYPLPESVSQWTAEQKRLGPRQWWENVRQPTWDKDPWYFNYVGHPYAGAIYYIRARERGFGAFGSFWYAALLSSLHEFGFEAFLERPSYQDLIVSPVAGALIGALLFEPIREKIKAKAELKWHDHLTLTLTDPLGASNRVLERLLGLKTAIRVQVRPPALAPHEQFHARTARALKQQTGHHHRRHGVNIEFIVSGSKK